MNHAGAPTNPYGMQETAPPPFSTIQVPECLPDTAPRPEAWNPGAPNYPWWTVNHKRKPEPDGGRLCELYLLAWIKELTRQHAADWLDLETSRADLEKQLVNLRKQSQVRGD